MTSNQSAPDLGSFFSPRNVAIVGASEDPIRIGGRPLEYMLRYKFSGQVYPVHLKHQQIQGVRAYSTLSAIPADVELAIIAVSVALAEAVIQEGIAKGIKAFIVFGSGYAELNEAGREAQHRLARLCNAAGVLLLGPNTIGCADSHSRLIASFSTAMDTSSLKQGRFSLVTQSGALGSYWMAMLDRQGLGFSKFIATGNEAGIDLAQCISYLAEDNSTDVIGVYIEGIKNVGSFRVAALKAAAAGKPIIAIKAGRSAVGAQAAASHTGSLAGEDANYQAFFEQFGIVRVRSLSEMIDTAKLIVKQPPPAGRRVGIVTISGGAGVLLADELEARGLGTPDFSEPTKKKLAAVLPSFIHPGNPLDHTAAVAGDPGLFDNVIKIVGHSDDHDSYIVFSGLLESIASKLVASLKEAFALSSKQIGVVWLGASPYVIKELEEAGIPVFADIPQAADAFRNIALSVERQTQLASLFEREWPATQSSELSKTNLPGRDTRSLSEHIAAQRVKSMCDITFPRQHLVTSVVESASVARLVGGFNFPLVAKLQSVAMPHRSDQGGVLLNLRSVQETQKAVEKLFELARTLDIEWDGVLIQEMHSISYELIVGIKKDELFGPLLVIGRGGIDVELRPDVQSAGLPLTESEIKSLLLKLESAPLFSGHRGRPVIDLDAMVRSLYQLTTACLSDKKLIELEINPLAITDDGRVIALDALATEHQT
ncbi:hypothetical protein AB833_14885 [Chromatiales bacterium (ex Bugula neritina AB1)]|nr:hypothetical protein AB833_14885 [Chromatiales bacterium (ex Bugula neritina AB1)]